MREYMQFYIGGQWVAPHGTAVAEVENPATGEAIGRVAMGDATDVDRAVEAACAAFPAWSATTPAQRIDHLERLKAAYLARYEDVSRAISDEVGAPITLARTMQAGSAPMHLDVAIDLLRDYPFDEVIGNGIVTSEPVGVCAMITPWNWPVHQLFCKIAPALAAGCTMVVKPSELAPLSTCIVAEIIAESGLPAGVFNLINGDGEVVGEAMASHRDVDLVSLTGSTRSGVAVSHAAAGTIKRVSLELGGKSACIVLPGADLDAAVRDCMGIMLRNCGQNCNAPSRLLVPMALVDRAAAIAAAVADAAVIGYPSDDRTELGPLASPAQFRQVQALIGSGIDDGAVLVAGGLGRPDGITTGHFVRPTVFAYVTPDMRVARDEIFGPVLCVIGYDDVDDAVRIANDTRYGLSGYVWGPDDASAVQAARRLRTGMVHINGAGGDFRMPFGGYKESGNGREWGRHGLEEFLEAKSLFGAAA
ncbi:aldehyde dehydrogenase family protein [Blastomonas fulva]|uniref:aldehyde dehydrogenase family protein n=1 Tax=Blastomonas fulva TaxID=1550728 RepID=UPI003F707AB9